VVEIAVEVVGSGLPGGEVEESVPVSPVTHADMASAKLASAHKSVRLRTTNSFYRAHCLEFSQKLKGPRVPKVEGFGIEIEDLRNRTVDVRRAVVRVHSDESTTAVLVIAKTEELEIARQVGQVVRTG
jgi:hypothetical protein